MFCIDTVADKSHDLMLDQITRGREGLGSNDQDFIVTTQRGNLRQMQRIWSVLDEHLYLPL